MVALLNGQVRSRPPKGAVSIDWGNTLANDLAVFVLGSSSRLENLATLNTPATISTHTRTEAPMIGESFAQLGSAGGIRCTTSITPKSTSNFTIAWYGAIVGTQASSPYISMLTFENGGNGSALRLGNGTSGARDKASFITGGTGVTGTTTIPLMRPVSVVGVNSASGIYVYVNGVRDGSAAAAAGTNIGVGFGFSTFGSRGLNGWHSYAAVWNRALTAEEVGRLACEPFAPIGRSGVVRPAFSSRSPFRGWGIQLAA